ncbi:MAG: hypothetical protein HPY76_05385 [Anaerolineae bacterium]|nr:hypothetical protein [Anaerolineae bacterium]
MIRHSLARMCAEGRFLGGFRCIAGDLTYVDTRRATRRSSPGGSGPNATAWRLRTGLPRWVGAVRNIWEQIVGAGRVPASRMGNRKGCPIT